MFTALIAPDAGAVNNRRLLAIDLAFRATVDSEIAWLTEIDHEGIRYSFGTAFLEDGPNAIFLTRKTEGKIIEIESRFFDDAKATFKDLIATSPLIEAERDAIAEGWVLQQSGRLA